MKKAKNRNGSGMKIDEGHVVVEQVDAKWAHCTHEGNDLILYDGCIIKQMGILCSLKLLVSQ